MLLVFGTRPEAINLVPVVKALWRAGTAAMGLVNLDDLSEAVAARG